MWWFLIGVKVSHFRRSAFRTLSKSGVQVLFLIILWYLLILCLFFQIFFIFWYIFMFFRSKDHFDYLWLMLVCFPLRGALQHIFKALNHALTCTTKRVTTYVTILLWNFLIISNALPLLARYQMCYCIPYHAFSIK